MNLGHIGTIHRIDMCNVIMERRKRSREGTLAVFIKDVIISKLNVGWLRGWFVLVSLRCRCMCRRAAGSSECDVFFVLLHAAVCACLR